MLYLSLREYHGKICTHFFGCDNDDDEDEDEDEDDDDDSPTDLVVALSHIPNFYSLAILSFG